MPTRATLTLDSTCQNHCAAVLVPGPAASAFSDDDEMADRLSIALPQERNYHTAAGFVLDQLGYLPAIGESFYHQGWRFEVIDLDGRRIDKILARRIGAGRRRAAV
jgi:CBS domain containing-hemolysin-like protein